MADGWSPLAMLPRDGREVWFTRSLNSVGNVVDLSAPAAGEPVIAGHLDPDTGLPVLGAVVSGDAPAEDSGWQPTHWMYDPDDPSPGPPDPEATDQSDKARIAAMDPQSRTAPGGDVDPADPEPAPKTKRSK